MEEYLRGCGVQNKAIEALSLLMAGQSLASVAVIMGWKEKSLKDLLRNTYKRLGVESFAQFRALMAKVLQ